RPHRRPGQHPQRGDEPGRGRTRLGPPDARSRRRRIRDHRRLLLAAPCPCEEDRFLGGHLRSLERLNRQPSWLLWATLPAALFVIAFGLWLHHGSIGPTAIDQSWLELVGLDRGSVPYWISVVLAEVGGGTGVVICTALLTGIFVLRRRLRSAIFLVTTMLADVAASEILKAIVTRLRLGDQLYESF